MADSKVDTTKTSVTEDDFDDFGFKFLCDESESSTCQPSDERKVNEFPVVSPGTSHLAQVIPINGFWVIKERPYIRQFKGSGPFSHGNQHNFQGQSRSRLGQKDSRQYSVKLHKKSGGERQVMSGNHCTKKLGITNASLSAAKNTGSSIAHPIAELKVKESPNLEVSYDDSCISNKFSAHSGVRTPGLAKAVGDISLQGLCDIEVDTHGCIVDGTLGDAHDMVRTGDPRTSVEQDSQCRIVANQQLIVKEPSKDCTPYFENVKKSISPSKISSKEGRKYSPRDPRIKRLMMGQDSPLTVGMEADATVPPSIPHGSCTTNINQETIVKGEEDNKMLGEICASYSAKIDIQSEDGEHDLNQNIGLTKLKICKVPHEKNLYISSFCEEPLSPESVEKSKTCTDIESIKIDLTQQGVLKDDKNGFDEAAEKLSKLGERYCKAKVLVRKLPELDIHKYAPSAPAAAAQLSQKSDLLQFIPKSAKDKQVVPKFLKKGKKKGPRLREEVVLYSEAMPARKLEDDLVLCETESLLSNNLTIEKYFPPQLEGKENGTIDAEISAGDGHIGSSVSVSLLEDFKADDSDTVSSKCCADPVNNEDSDAYCTYLQKGDGSLVDDEYNMDNRYCPSVANFVQGMNKSEPLDVGNFFSKQLNSDPLAKTHEQNDTCSTSVTLIENTETANISDVAEQLQQKQTVEPDNEGASMNEISEEIMQVGREQKQLEPFYSFNNLAHSLVGASCDYKDLGDGQSLDREDFEIVQSIKLHDQSLSHESTQTGSSELISKLDTEEKDNYSDMLMVLEREDMLPVPAQSLSHAPIKKPKLSIEDTTESATAILESALPFAETRKKVKWDQKKINRSKLTLPLLVGQSELTVAGECSTSRSRRKHSIATRNGSRSENQTMMEKMDLPEKPEESLSPVLDPATALEELRYRLFAEAGIDLRKPSHSYYQCSFQRRSKQREIDTGHKNKGDLTFASLTWNFDDSHKLDQSQLRSLDTHSNLSNSYSNCTSNLAYDIEGQPKNMTAIDNLMTNKVIKSAESVTANKQHIRREHNVAKRKAIIRRKKKYGKQKYMKTLKTTLYSPKLLLRSVSKKVRRSSLKPSLVEKIVLRKEFLTKARRPKIVIDSGGVDIQERCQQEEVISGGDKSGHFNSLLADAGYGKEANQSIALHQPEGVVKHEECIELSSIMMQESDVASEMNNFDDHTTKSKVIQIYYDCQSSSLEEMKLLNADKCDNPNFLKKSEALKEWAEEKTDITRIDKCSVDGIKQADEGTSKSQLSGIRTNIVTQDTVKVKSRPAKCIVCGHIFKSKHLLQRHRPCRIKQTRTWSQKGLRSRPNRVRKEPVVLVESKAKAPKKPRLLQESLAHRKSKFKVVKGKARRRLLQAIRELMEKRKKSVLLCKYPSCEHLPEPEQFFFRLGLLKKERSAEIVLPISTPSSLAPVVDNSSLTAVSTAANVEILEAGLEDVEFNQGPDLNDDNISRTGPYCCVCYKQSCDEAKCMPHFLGEMKSEIAGQNPLLYCAPELGAPHGPPMIQPVLSSGSCSANDSVEVCALNIQEQTSDTVSVRHLSERHFTDFFDEMPLVIKRNIDLPCEDGTLQATLAEMPLKAKELSLKAAKQIASKIHQRHFTDAINDSEVSLSLPLSVDATVNIQHPSKTLSERISFSHIRNILDYKGDKQLSRNSLMNLKKHLGDLMISIKQRTKLPASDYSQTDTNTFINISSATVEASMEEVSAKVVDNIGCGDHSFQDRIQPSFYEGADVVQDHGVNESNLSSNIADSESRSCIVSNIIDMLNVLEDRRNLTEDVHNAVELITANFGIGFDEIMQVEQLNLVKGIDVCDALQTTGNSYTHQDHVSDTAARVPGDNSETSHLVEGKGSDARHDDSDPISIFTFRDDIADGKNDIVKEALDTTSCNVDVINLVNDMDSKVASVALIPVEPTVTFKMQLEKSEKELENDINYSPVDQQTEDSKPTQTMSNPHEITLVKDEASNYSENKLGLQTSHNADLLNTKQNETFDTPVDYYDPESFSMETVDYELSAEQKYDAPLIKDDANYVCTVPVEDSNEITTDFSSHKLCRNEKKDFELVAEICEPDSCVAIEEPVVCYEYFTGRKQVSPSKTERHTKHDHSLFDKDSLDGTKRVLLDQDRYFVETVNCEPHKSKYHEVNQWCPFTGYAIEVSDSYHQVGNNKDKELVVGSCGARGGNFPESQVETPEESPVENSIESQVENSIESQVETLEESPVENSIESQVETPKESLVNTSNYRSVLTEPCAVIHVTDCGTKNSLDLDMTTSKVDYDSIDASSCHELCASDMSKTASLDSNDEKAIELSSSPKYYDENCSKVQQSIPVYSQTSERLSEVLGCLIDKNILRKNVDSVQGNVNEQDVNFEDTSLYGSLLPDNFSSSCSSEEFVQNRSSLERNIVNETCSSGTFENDRLEKGICPEDSIIDGSDPNAHPHLCYVETSCNESYTQIVCSVQDGIKCYNELRISDRESGILTEGNLGCVPSAEIHVNVEKSEFQTTDVGSSEREVFVSSNDKPCIYHDCYDTTPVNHENVKGNNGTSSPCAQPDILISAAEPPGNKYEFGMCVLENSCSRDDYTRCKSCKITHSLHVEHKCKVICETVFKQDSEPVRMETSGILADVQVSLANPNISVHKTFESECGDVCLVARVCYENQPGNGEENKKDSTPLLGSKEPVNALEDKDEDPNTACDYQGSVSILITHSDVDKVPDKYTGSDAEPFLIAQQDQANDIKWTSPHFVDNIQHSTQPAYAMLCDKRDVTPLMAQIQLSELHPNDMTSNSSFQENTVLHVPEDHACRKPSADVASADMLNVITEHCDSVQMSTGIRNGTCLEEMFEKTESRTALLSECLQDMFHHPNSINTTEATSEFDESSEDLHENVSYIEESNRGLNLSYLNDSCNLSSEPVSISSAYLLDNHNITIKHCDESNSSNCHKEGNDLESSLSEYSVLNEINNRGEKECGPSDIVESVVLEDLDKVENTREELGVPVEIAAEEVVEEVVEDIEPCGLDEETFSNQPVVYCVHEHNVLDDGVSHH